MKSNPMPLQIARIKNTPKYPNLLTRAYYTAPITIPESPTMAIKILTIFPPQAGPYNYADTPPNKVMTAP